MLYLRNTSFSKLAAVTRHRLSVKTAPHTENTLSLDVLVACTDNNCLAMSAITGNRVLCSFHNCKISDELLGVGIRRQVSNSSAGEDVDGVDGAIKSARKSDDVLLTSSHIRGRLASRDGKEPSFIGFGSVRVL